MSNKKKYRISKLFKLQENDNNFFVVNLLSKKMYKLNELSYNLLHKLDNHTFSLESIDNVGISKSEMEQFANLMIQHSVFIEENQDETLLLLDPYYPFLNKSIQNKIEICSNSLFLLGVPYFKGNIKSYGTRKFPNSIRRYFYTNGIKSFNSLNNLPFSISENYIKNFVWDIGDIFIYDNEYSSISLIKIQKIIERIAKKSNKLIALGGDHTITYPIVNALSKYNNNIIYIHLDAHTDYYSSPIDDIYQQKGYTSINHSNFVTEITKNKNVNQVIQFGIRGIPNYTNITKEKIYSFAPTQKKAFYKKLLSCDDNSVLYISIDIDFFNPSIAPATSTTEISGLYLKDFIEIIEVIKSCKNKVIGADLVEVNPDLDTNNSTIQLASIILFNLLTLFESDE